MPRLAKLVKGPKLLLLLQPHLLVQLVHCVQLLARQGLNDGGAVAVAYHVISGAAPADQPVNRPEKGNVSHWGLNGVEPDEHENQRSRGNGSRSNRSS